MDSNNLQTSASHFQETSYISGIAWYYVRFNFDGLFTLVACSLQSSHLLHNSECLSAEAFCTTLVSAVLAMSLPCSLRSIRIIIMCKLKLALATHHSWRGLVPCILQGAMKSGKHTANSGKEGPSGEARPRDKLTNPIIEEHCQRKHVLAIVAFAGSTTRGRQVLAWATRGRKRKAGKKGLTRTEKIMSSGKANRYQTYTGGSASPWNS